MYIEQNVKNQMCATQDFLVGFIEESYINFY